MKKPLPPLSDQEKLARKVARLRASGNVKKLMRLMRRWREARFGAQKETQWRSQVTKT